MTDRLDLQSSLDTPAGKRRYVRRLFATIADRYDLITVLLSYGGDARWKRRLVSMSAAGAGVDALDLACGTGDIAFAVAARGARVTGLDITFRMVELAKEKGTATVLQNSKKGDCPRFLVGDMLALPFAAASFDLVTTGYGIRNVPDIDAALAEIRRVLRPGGRFLSLDFNRPSGAFLRSVYLTYLTIVGSTLGWLLHRDPDTYRYIPESIRRYPGAAAIVDRLEAHGFESARYLPVLGGLMAIHAASASTAGAGQLAS
jgi:demethylmenaquinone methyltransferase/2-methoxy-6-polyprenyl-1,4-benzoquinol methylase